MKATKSIIIDNMNFRLEYRDTDSVYWYFTSPILRINKYKGLWSYASIKCPDTIIENSYLEYEDMSFLNMDTADKDSITVLNTTFKSYFGSSGGHNYVLFVNGHTTVKFDNNTLLTKDGCVITEPSQMVLVR